MLATHSKRNCNRAILDYVQRYSIGIERMLCESITGDVRRSLRQLIAAGQLREHQHPCDFRYVTIGHRPELSETAFVRRYAILRFCESFGSSRSLLTRSETEKYFPNVFRQGMPNGHYIDTSEVHPRFGHIRVDAVPGRTCRILSRAADLIDRYRQSAGIRQLIAQKQFEITFVVATSHKARRLHMDFQQLRQSGVTVRAYEIPELLELMAPLGTAGLPSPTNQSITHSQL